MMWLIIFYSSEMITEVLICTRGSFSLSEKSYLRVPPLEEIVLQVQTQAPAGGHAAGHYTDNPVS